MIAKGLTKLKILLFIRIRDDYRLISLQVSFAVTTLLLVSSLVEVRRKESSSFTLDHPLLVESKLKRLSWVSHLYHVHIPKCGGTTVHRTLSCCNSDTRNLNERMPDDNWAHLPCVISSELFYDEIPKTVLNKNTFLFIITRNKISWYKSALKHNFRNDKIAPTTSIEVMRRKKLGYFYYDNLYSKYITLELLQKFNFLICDLSYIDKCTELISSAFNIKAEANKRHNSAPHSQDYFDFSNYSAVESVLREDHLDTEIMRFVGDSTLLRVRNTTTSCKMMKTHWNCKSRNSEWRRFLHRYARKFK